MTSATEGDGLVFLSSNSLGCQILVELSRNLGSAGSGVMEDLPGLLSSLGAGKANAEPSDVTFETTHNAQREGEFQHV